MINLYSEGLLNTLQDYYLLCRITLNYAGLPVSAGLIFFLQDYSLLFRITLYNSVQMFEPFQDRNPHLLGTVSLS